MKLLTFLSIVFLSFHCYTQKDTLRVYHANGLLRISSPRVNGELHGVTIMKNQTGTLFGLTTYKNGKQISSIQYYESGVKKYFSRTKKWTVKTKMWHPNGKLWVISNSKYWRSFTKEFDSTGFRLKKLVEKRGSQFSCLQSISENESDSVSIPSGFCNCSWGRATYVNKIWTDEKGRDLTSNYKYKLQLFYPNGTIQEESIIDNKKNLNTTRRFDENGVELFDIQ